MTVNRVLSVVVLALAAAGVASGCASEENPGFASDSGTACNLMWCPQGNGMGVRCCVPNTNACGMNYGNGCIQNPRHDGGT